MAQNQLATGLHTISDGLWFGTTDIKFCLEKPAKSQLSKLPKPANYIIPELPNLEIMDFEIFSYRYAREIIEHATFNQAYQEILAVIHQCPVFSYPNKSVSNPRLDVVQQLSNTFFDRKFVCDLNWDYHPNATNIPNSGLAADYRKNFNGLRIQAEVQFGNMSRWYSDIFKFQTAYSQDVIDMGLCIVPMFSIATRIDSNVTNFERCIRELPSAKLSITLPILLIGLKNANNQQPIDVSQCGLITNGIRDITGKGRVENRYKIINGFLNNIPMSQIQEESETGPVASLIDDEPED